MEINIFSIFLAIFFGRGIDPNLFCDNWEKLSYNFTIFNSSAFRNGMTLEDWGKNGVAHKQK